MSFGRKKAAADRQRGIDQLQQTFTSSGLRGFADTGAQANAATAGALGLTGDAGSEEAFRRYQGSTGFLGQLDAGRRAIEGSAAARGKLNSGATLKSLTSYGQNLGRQSFNDYLGFLGNLSGRGQEAATTGFDAIGEAQLSAADARAQSRGKLASGALGFGAGLAKNFLFG